MSRDVSHQTVPAAAPRPATGLIFYAIVLGTFLAASSAPTPLYRVYQHTWDFSPIMLTVIFSVYAFSLLLSLLFVGSLSDHVGRRPVIFASLLGQALALLLFFLAENTTMLIAARVVQGLATGAASGAVGAALVDMNRTRGPIVNSIAPLLGMAMGALGSSALVQFAPAPMHLVYAVLLVVVLLQALLIWRIPETVGAQPGALASLRPQINVPARAKSALMAITPLNISVWALGGFYLSLVPSVVSVSTGNSAPLVGGLVVATLTVSGAIAVFVLREKHPGIPLAIGPLAMILGVLTVLAGIHFGLTAPLLVGTAIAGIGFGSSFLGSVRTIMPLAAADERAGLLSAFYIQSYLAFSVPAIAGGLLSHEIGLAPATDVYAGFILLLSLGGLVTIRRTGLNRTAPL